jgi:stage II sporulation protein AA (anti-sigma F factor antagonist)
MIKTNHTFCAEFYDGTLRVTLEGEIDHHSAVATRGEIDRLIYEYRPRRFELALSRIGFMDSSGLGLVMGRYTLVHDLGGEMVVLDPSPAILRIFKLAGMDRLIRIEYGEKPQAVPKTDNAEKGEE